MALLTPTERIILERIRKTGEASRDWLKWAKSKGYVELDRSRKGKHLLTEAGLGALHRQRAKITEAGDSAGSASLPTEMAQLSDSLKLPSIHSDDDIMAARSAQGAMNSPFAKPWVLVEREKSFEIASANGRILAYVYFEDEQGRRDVTKRITREDARRLAIQIQRLPETLAEPKLLRRSIEGGRAVGAGSLPRRLWDGLKKGLRRPFW